MVNPRLWYVNVFVSDLVRAVEFYRDVLGMPLQFQDAEFGYASLEGQGIRLGLARVEPGTPEMDALLGRHTGVGLGVPDLKAAHEQLLDQGVRFLEPPERRPWGGFMATFADPDGNVFYLDELREE